MFCMCGWNEIVAYARAFEFSSITRSISSLIVTLMPSVVELHVYHVVECHANVWIRVDTEIRMGG